jgi:hypothetical protein
VKRPPILAATLVTVLTVLVSLLGVGLASTPPATAAVPASQPAPQAAAQPAPRVASRPDLTMQMRDAVLHPRASISSPCMSQGRRPTDCGVSLPDVLCDGHGWICVHYTTTGSNQSTYSTSQRKPGWVQTTLATLDHIYATYQGAGYQMPLSDGTAGGTSAIDIYLVDLTSVDGGAFADYYGYCTPTTAASAAAPRYSAFCVLDNDYQGMTTPTETATDVLDVTASHEFFHAVQFGYNAKADTWIMEATATWAEDELYTDVNDNRQYLAYSPLGLPGVPLDDWGPNAYGATLAGGRSDPRAFLVYGDWIFFRYLTERLPQAQGGLPVLVRQIWQRMSATEKRPAYSIQAVAAALKADHTSLTQQWGGFVAANRHPATSYSEGSAYPTARPDGSVTFRRQRRHTASGSGTLAHLTARTQRFVSHKVRPRKARLRVVVHVPRARQGSTAVVLSIWHRGGAVTERTLRLRKGAGRARVPFASQKVSRVELTVGNADIDYRCGQPAKKPNRYSCDGTPKGDGLTVSWKATLVRG